MSVNIVNILAIYDINTLFEREQARDSVPVPSVTEASAPWLIYNSRNFICIYTGSDERRQNGLIYNSRNFICIYTK